MNGSLMIRSADGSSGAAVAPCEARMSMMSGWNFVSLLRSRRADFAAHEGPLSIKCVMAGEEVYEVEGARLIVQPSSYLLLNHGQRYASAIQADRAVESFCIWFRPGFVEQALAGQTLPAERLLDDPGRTGGLPAAFYERLYPADDLVSPQVDLLYRAFDAEWTTREWLQEQFHRLAARLVAAHHNAHREVEQLPAVRPSTRMEIYRRLHRAKDYLDASLTMPVTLADAAAVACMSPHHFLRLFKQVFHETPHQYRSRRRLERVQQLLRDTDTPITRICFDLGFESLGSFSWLFRRRFGLSPTEYRTRNGSGVGGQEPLPGEAALSSWIPATGSARS